MTRERIITIRILDKIEKDPKYAKWIGIQAGKGLADEPNEEKG